MSILSKVLVLLLTIVLPLQAQLPKSHADYDLCSQLEESNGIVVKFKNVSEFDSSTKTSLRKYSKNSEVKTKIETILRRKIKEVKPVYENSKNHFSKLKLKNPTKISSRRAFKINKLNQLISDHNFDLVYLISKKDLNHIHNYKKRSANIKKLNFNQVKKLQSIMPYSCGTELEKDLSKLRQDPDLEYAEPNLKVKKSTDDRFFRTLGSWGQSYDDLWGIKKIKADQAWSLSQGEGMVVAVVDQGIDYNHPDLWDNIWVDPSFVDDRNNDGQINLDDLDLNANKFIDNGEYIDGALGKSFISVYADDSSFIRNSEPPIDRGGHGTHVAGTIAGVGNNSIGVIGVAPKAKLVAVKGLDDSGAGYDSDLADALIYAASVADIANNSWGGYGESKLLEEAFSIANDSGMVSIAAAGNEGMDARYSIPSSFNAVISVSASTPTDSLASFSNYGFSVDVAAPGGADDDEEHSYNILSTANLNHFIIKEIPDIEIKDTSANSNPYTYMRLAGTSMATPHIAGAVALLKSLNPELNTEELRAILRYSVNKLNSSIYAGTGVIDVLAALKLNSIPPLVKLDDLPETSSGLIKFRGKAFTEFPMNYTISYKTDLSTEDLWTTIVSSSNSIAYGNLGSFDTSSLKDGDYTFKLEAFDNNGLKSIAYAKTRVKNIIIDSPLSGDVYRPKTIIPLKLSSTLSNFKSMSVGYRKRGDNKWKNLGITLTNEINPDGTVQEIGTWNTAKLDADDFYDLKFDIEKSNGQTDTIIKASIYLDSLLKPGFPIHVSTLGADLLPFARFIQELDFENDGKKELVTISGPIVVSQDPYREKTFFNAYSSDGELIWKKELPKSGSCSATSLLSEDLDNDGKKDIIISCYDYVHALNHNGEELKGWPFYIPYPANVDYQGENLSVYSGLSSTAIILSPNNQTKSVLLNFAIAVISDINGNALYQNLTLIVDANAEIKKSFVVPVSSNGLDLAYFGERQRNIALANLDQDDDYEFVTSSGANEILALNQDGTMVPGWPIKARGRVLAFTAADLDRDGLDEISFTTRDSTDIYQELYGSSDLQLDSLSLVNYQGKALNGWPLILDNSIYLVDDSLPSVADFDGDGDLEINLPCSYCEHQQYLLQGNGKSLANWPLDIKAYKLGEGDDYSYRMEIQDSSLVADINDDAKVDLITNYGGGIWPTAFLYDISTVGAIRAWSLNGQELDLNPNPEIKGLVRESVDFLYSWIEPERTMPTNISDLDNDGLLDIISSNLLDLEYNFDQSQGANISDILDSGIERKNRFSIYAWSLPSPAQSGRIDWSRGDADSLGSHNYDYLRKKQITPLSDIEPPTRPSNLVVKREKKNNHKKLRVKLKWSISTDDVGVIGYKIYRDGKIIGISRKVKFIDKEANPNYSYVYRVSAFDAAGHESEKIEKML